MHSFINIFIIISILILKIQCDFEWMYYVPYGTDVTLKPLKRNQNETIEVKDCKWTTPNNNDLLPDQVNYESERYRIDKTKCELTIYNIQADTNGIYHCTINKIHISKAMLNYHGPPPKDLLDEYKWNLIAGFSTAGGILALFIFIWAINKFRYREAPVSESNIYQVNSGYEMSTRNVNQIQSGVDAYRQDDGGYDNEIDIDAADARAKDEDKLSQTSVGGQSTRLDQMHRF